MRSFTDLVNQLEKRQKLDEVAPPGFEGTVKAMKKHKDIDNPYALAWYEKNKGDKSHRKASGAKKTEGMGSIDSVAPDSIEAVGSDRITEKHIGFKKLEKKLAGKKGAKDAGAIAASIGDKKYGKKKMKKAATTGKALKDSQKESANFVGRYVQHPTKGNGQIVFIKENAVGVRFERLDLRMAGPARFTFAEAKNYLRMLPESYSRKAEKADVNASKKKKSEKKSEKKDGKKKKIKEAWMMAIPGTYVGNSAGTEVKKPMSFDLTAEDLGLIVREEEEESEDKNPFATSDGGDRESAEEATDWSQDTIDMKPTRDTPLSVEDGEESAEDTGPHVKDDMVMPDDAPSVPKAKQMDQSQSGNARSAASGSSDGSSNPFAKKSASKADDSDKSDSEESDSKEEKSMSEQKKRAGVKPGTKPSYKTLIESMTFEDLEECGGNMQPGRMGEGTGMMMASQDANEGIGMANPEQNLSEHNMAAGEIAVTQDLMVAILKAVVEAGLDESKLNLVAQAVAECCQEDRTLDVSDAGAIQKKLQELVQGGSAGGSEGSEEGSEGGEENSFEDKAAGDGEPAGPEAGPEHEGETKLMRDEDGEGEDHDEDGEEFHVHFGHDEGSEESHEDHSDEGSEESHDDGESEGSEEHHEESHEEEPKHEEAKESRKAQPKTGKKNIKESFYIAPIGGTYRGNERAEINADQSDEDAEIAMIKYRAGIK